MNQCQVRKGILGDLESFNSKKEENNFGSKKAFVQKASIKPYNKNEIKVDKFYNLRENMEEKEIIPEFYMEEENTEIDDSAIEELAISLKGSIDKSTDISVNESIRRSINISSSQNMVSSLLNSINNEGKGILGKLKLAFENSQNKEI